jgi:predicted transglutaminase-like cysteine proteinase
MRYPWGVLALGLVVALGDAHAQTAAERRQAWHALLAGLAGAPEVAQVEAVNRFVNQAVVFAEDRTTWGHADYWANPHETLARGRGDCEDYAIAKFFSLRRLGIDADRLWLTYAMLRTGGRDSRVEQAHMVLAYYPTPAAEPLILDNMLSSPHPASRRDDLRPIFRFNDRTLRIGRDRHPARVLPAWRRVLAATRN